MSKKKEYDDLIAEAVSLGLSEDRELNKIGESDLRKLINSTKNKTKADVPVKQQEPRKHDFFRG